MRLQLKLWDSKRERERERERINLQKILNKGTAGLLQNKGRTEQFQRRASGLRTHPSPARGRRQRGGERGRLGPRTTSSTTLQTGLQFLTKDFLRFWMVDICREGHS